MTEPPPPYPGTSDVPGELLPPYPGTRDVPGELHPPYPVTSDATAASYYPDPSDVPIVLVTGASGYLATHIIKQLLDQAHVHVRGTVRSMADKSKVAPLQELGSRARYPLQLVEADLLHPQSWVEAVRGCSYVYHVASPFLVGEPAHPDGVMKPAVEGTINVLSACRDSGTVKRVVLTSSISAVSGGNIAQPSRPQNYVFTEDDWSNPAPSSLHHLSKYEAEKRAWDFVKGLENNEKAKFELVTCCPGRINGPLLSRSSGAATAHGFSIFMQGMAGVPDLYFATIDVRDAATAHIRAMDTPIAAGKRYLLVHNRPHSFKETIDILREEFEPQGYTFSRRTLPKAVFWIMKWFNTNAKTVYQSMGHHSSWNNSRMKKELGIEPRPYKNTVLDMAYSVIELGFVPKKAGYIGHPSTR